MRRRTLPVLVIAFAVLAGSNAFGLCRTTVEVEVLATGVSIYATAYPVDPLGCAGRTFGISLDGGDTGSISCAATGCASSRLWNCIPPGPHVVAAYTADDRVEKTFAADRRPTIDNFALRRVNHAPGVAGRGVQLRFDYANPPNTDSHFLSVDLLGWTDANGVQYARRNLGASIVPASGVIDAVYETPTGAKQLTFMVSASNCAGTRDQVMSIECGECDSGATNDPVSFAEGNMRLTDTDPLPAVGGISLVRTYDSDEQVGGLFGRGWTSVLDRRLIRNAHAPGELVSIVTATNEVVTFQQTANGFRQLWPTARAVQDTLTYDASSATYVHRQARATDVAVFGAGDGKLVGIRSLTTGREALVFYDAAGVPLSVADSFSGLQWDLTTTAQRRVVSIAVSGRPDLVWNYAYDAAGNLTTVDAPGGSAWRTYEYAGNRMTASRDPLGNLIESHTYDGSYAVTSTGPGDEIASIAYNLAAESTRRTTRITLKTGAVIDYELRPSGGAWRTVRSTEACAACAVGFTTIVRDVQGRPLLTQSADGYITAAEYSDGRLINLRQHLKPADCDPQSDATHCRRDAGALRATVLATIQETTNTMYLYADPAWPDLPTSERTESVLSPGALRLRSTNYHSATGTVVSSVVTGRTGADGHTEVRTTTTTLYGVGGNSTVAAFAPGGTFASEWLSLPQPFGRPMYVDGPRTDVADVLALVYFPLAQSVPSELRGMLAATRDAAGNVSRYDAYDIFGNVRRTVDPNGVLTDFTLDALGRMVSQTLRGVAGCDTAADPQCATDLVSTRTYGAGGAGPLQSEQRLGGGVTSYVYDSRGRLRLLSRGASVSDLREQIEISYDPATGKKSVERTLALADGSAVEKQREWFTYDLRGHLAAVQHADGSAIHYGYDDSGRVAAVRDENHSTPNTQYTYDAAGRLAKVRQTLAGAPGGAVETAYAYDRHGNLVSVTDPHGSVTNYVYDDFGRMLSQTSPVTGTTSYAYDLAGNLISTIDANGAQTTRTYDASGRALSATSVLGSASENVVWTYDATTSGAYGRGRLATMEDPSGTTAYTYERRGLLSVESRSFSGNTWVQTYGYDADGNRSSMRYPSGRRVTYQYDYAGRPVTAAGTYGGESTTFVSAAAYLPFGPLTSLSLGNGTTETRGYDGRYRQVTNTLSSGTVTLAQYTYSIDPAGNITSIADAANPSYSRTFGYDDVNRLTTANTGSGLWGSGAYSYDAIGNLRSATLGSITRTFTYQGMTTKIATAPGLATAMTYDAAGNELKSPAGNPSDGSAAAVYSPRNLLQAQFLREYDRCYEELGSACVQSDVVQVWLSNLYDGRGVRTASTEIALSNALGDGDTPPTPTFYFYAPELKALNVASRSTGRSADVIWFGDRPMADVDGGEVRYTFTDHLGTPILQTSQAATIVWRAEYEPFGSVYTLRSGAAADDQPLRFPGQQVAYSTAAGEEMYNIFRWYRAGWGRYTSADPIGLQGGVNLYAYALDNPLRFDDPFGLRVRMCCRIIPFTVGLGNALSMMPPGASLPPQRHCFFQFENSPNNQPLGLHGTQSAGGYMRAILGRDTGRVITNAPFDQGTDASDTCGPWAQDPCNDADQCVRNAGGNYPSPSQYSLLGPNSNTFAFNVARQCYVKPPWPVHAPGWNAAPPQP
jgi:RHS repeat-associated protein